MSDTRYFPSISIEYYLKVPIRRIILVTFSRNVWRTMLCHHAFTLWQYFSPSTIDTAPWICCLQCHHIRPRPCIAPTISRDTLSLARLCSLWLRINVRSLAESERARDYLTHASNEWWLDAPDFYIFHSIEVSDLFICLDQIIFRVFLRHILHIIIIFASGRKSRI